MSLRGLLWVMVAALLLYGAWQGLRALAAGRATRNDAAGKPDGIGQSRNTDTDDEADDSDGFDYAPSAPSTPYVSPSPQPQSQPLRAEPAEGDVFRLDLEIQRLRRELEDMRTALGDHQEEIGALNDELRTLREQIETAFAGQGAAPQYSEALVFARRGLAADAIAERCDISVAEAELVRALAARGSGGNA